MNINRHNYEEFFLLYVDNELTAEQKKSVEQFIQENPDLAIELQLLQQTTLHANDRVVFDGKEMLLKKDTASAINMDNYEEYLISYIDDELTDAERMEFFRFAAAHPQVQEELSVYEQTRLQPEKQIVFENKQVLYRREERVRVISMQWWKIAVAAAVILGIALTTLSVFNKKDTAGPNQVAVKENQPKEKNTVAPQVTEIQDIKKEEKENVTTVPANKETVASVTLAEKKTTKSNSLVQKTTEEKIQQELNAPGKNESVAVNPVANKSNDAGTAAHNNVTANAAEAVKKSAEPGKTNDIAVINNLPKENNSKPVTPETDKPLDNKETAQDFTNSQPEYASYDEGKNKKTRGFFRKAARVFERRTNISAADDEDREDKLLIGALAVKLK